MHALEIAGVEYVSTAKVLTDAGISRQTLWRWRREGRIPRGHRFRNGHLLFTTDEYRQVLEFAYRVEPEGVSGTSLGSIEAGQGVVG